VTLARGSSPSGGSHGGDFPLLQGSCTESSAELAGELRAGVADLARNGIHESEDELAAHVAGAVPAGMTTRCGDLIAAYLVLREQPSGG